MHIKLNSLVFTVLAGLGGVASANLVHNAGFEQTTFTDPKQSIGANQATNWTSNRYNFLFTPDTATSTSAVLSFPATGTPTGNPPFSLLDNVQLNAVPEPDSLAFMFAGLGLPAVSWRRRRTTTPLAA